MFFLGGGMLFGNIGQGLLDDVSKKTSYYQEEPGIAKWQASGQTGSPNIFRVIQWQLRLRELNCEKPFRDEK